MKIWVRYLLRLLLKTFLFLLVCLFIIYAIIDLTIHGVRFFSHGSIQWTEVTAYYLHNFATHLDFFFPLTLLFTILKVLLDLNSHNELVALQIAGLSQKKLLIPFFIFAAFLGCISYANHEWIAPSAQEAADTFQLAHTKKKKKASKTHVYSASLQNQSELVYQEFLEKTDELFDVYWIKSNKDIWHIKFLKIDPSGENIPIGRFADHLQRTKGHKLEKTESHLTYSFPEIVLDNNVTLQTFIPFENRSLSTLCRQALKPTVERRSIICHLHYKLATPLIPFLILLTLSPIVMRFSRLKSTVLITAISLFSFIGFMTILEGMLILGENQVIPGYIAIWGPIALVLLFATPRFYRAG